MSNVMHSAIPADWTAAQWVADLGSIPLERIRMCPPPGTATEQDVVASEIHEDRLCELIDGVLVEKAMGTYESLLAVHIIRCLDTFVQARDLGIVLAPDAMLRILPAQVRMPDVCFISWQRLPGRAIPKGPVWGLVPDLAVEILSEGNTEAEMQRKLREYVEAGVRQVWYIDPASRSARSYTAVDRVEELTREQVLSGGDVLSGFELSLAELFSRAPLQD